MGLAFTPLAIVGFAYLAVLAPLAWTVYRAAPTRAPNRRLAVFLALYACIMVARFALRPMATDLPTAYAAGITYSAAVYAIMPVYVLLVATLDSPLTRPFRSRVGTLALVAVAIVGALWPIAFPNTFITGVNPEGSSPYLGRYQFFDGVGYQTFTYLLAATLLFALVASLTAWRRAAPGSVARSRAGAFALAFGIHDALFLADAALLLSIGEMGHPLGTAYLRVVEVSAPGILIALLSYAFLRWQLFDIDLKIKRGVRRGTVVAAFVVVFLVAEQLVTNLVSAQLGLAAGIVAAVALGLAVRPLERLGERVADAAMPRVNESEGYLVARKLAIYRATVEGALADGVITDKERAMLERLRGELEIDAATAGRLEDDARAAAAA